MLNKLMAGSRGVRRGRVTTMGTMGTWVTHIFLCVKHGFLHIENVDNLLGVVISDKCEILCFDSHPPSTWLPLSIYLSLRWKLFELQQQPVFWHNVSLTWFYLNHSFATNNNKLLRCFASPVTTYWLFWLCCSLWPDSPSATGFLSCFDLFHSLLSEPKILALRCVCSTVRSIR